MFGFCLCTSYNNDGFRFRALWPKCRVFFCVLFSIFLAGCGGNVEIVSNIPERDANEVLSALLDSGIEATKSLNKDGLATVYIDSSKVSTAINILRSRGLPRFDYRGLGDVFKKDGMISSPMEEKARLLFALSEELSETLSHIDGVVFSRVHLVLPDHDPFTDTTIVSSAAVFIKYQKEYNIDILIPQIKKLVARSIPGLTEDRVTVVLIPAEEYTTPDVKQQRLDSINPDKSQMSIGSDLSFAVIGIFVAIVLFLAIGYYLIWTNRISLPVKIPGINTDNSEKSNNRKS
ncbi:MULTISPECIES: type III secretion system inner membrane ring lipoprotein SctJ [Candidatus Ichthyocystis]|uniref:type III secretion system inner membrane ring lipoprotein SctJ n=1 Tax=Candidatus Ichthyocystis TaxID=2929841 RepID=UPI000B86D676|nr:MULTISPECIES: type III secretion inner membrane ring lipoprotein SctJ [Ichthyocystis]